MPEAFLIFYTSSAALKILYAGYLSTFQESQLVIRSLIECFRSDSTLSTDI